MGHPPAGGAPPGRRPAALVPLTRVSPAAPILSAEARPSSTSSATISSTPSPGCSTGRSRSRISRERNPARFPVRGYAARRYADGLGGVSSTEVVSVGVDQLYQRPGEFAKEDPEYFDFIWENVVKRR